MVGATRVAGWADEKARIERLCLSPYVKEPLNSKVIKGFVPELRSRYVFFEFRDPMLYIYEHYMPISHIHIRVYGYGIGVRKSIHQS